ncbi:unnamed protein product [Brugia timori]|uniref:Uncharacterized protein n=1 Tax=Brugia timori TaxID=42155 RepID=A0A3P7VN20_9BILA|nr:unnamed protein product [Brugia timori]
MVHQDHQDKKDHQESPVSQERQVLTLRTVLVLSVLLTFTLNQLNHHQSHIVLKRQKYIHRMKLNYYHLMNIFIHYCNQITRTSGIKIHGVIDIYSIKLHGRKQFQTGNRRKRVKLINFNQMNHFCNKSVNISVKCRNKVYCLFTLNKSKIQKLAK